MPEEDRWALSYYVLALSAYKDPLTLQPLAIADTDRAALNDLTLEAASPDKAYVPGGHPAQKASDLGEGGSVTGKQNTAEGG